MKRKLITDKEILLKGMEAIIDSPKVKKEFPVTTKLLEAIVKDNRNINSQ